MCRAETEAREDDQSKKPLQAYGAVTILVSDMARYYFKVQLLLLLHGWRCQDLRGALLAAVLIMSEFLKNITVAVALTLMAQDRDKTVLPAQFIQLLKRRHLAFASSLVSFPHLIVPGSTPITGLLNSIALRELLPVNLLCLVRLEKFGGGACIWQPELKVECFPGKALRPPSHNENQVAEAGAFGL